MKVIADLPLSHHWKSIFPGPKNGSDVEFSCSVYLYEEQYRCCMACSKQKYYFEIPVSSIHLFTTLTAFEEIFNKFFNENRQDCQIAKCLRCSKWHVREGIFCPRCLIANRYTSNTVLDILI